MSLDELTVAGAGPVRLHCLPYHTVFVVEPGCIYFLAVAHNSRRPAYWVRRLSGRP